MAKSLNNVQLIGNIGRDPEVKYTPNGVPVAKVGLATNEKYKDKAGEWQESVEWHSLVFWKKLAEIAGEYLKKGSKIFVEGRLKTEKWEHGGQNFQRTEIVVKNMIFLGGQKEGAPGRAAEDAPTHEISEEDIPF